MSLEDKVKWSERKDKNQNPLQFLKRHYRAGLTRGQLAKRDIGLYQRLWKDGLLESVPTADISEVRKQSSRFGTDPVAYYNQHHAGLTRGELARQDPGLYERLRREGLLGQVPTADLSEVRKQFSRFGNDPFAYYQQHHAGLTRGKLEMLCPSLYKRLRRDGLLGSVPVSRTDFGNNPITYYQKHHAGLTRGKLQLLDHGLYERLRRDGALGQVPIQKEQRDFGTDPIVYYNQHHAGLTRGQLQKQNQALYRRLWRKGLLKFVPKKSHKSK